MMTSKKAHVLLTDSASKARRAVDVKYLVRRPFRTVYLIRVPITVSVVSNNYSQDDRSYGSQRTVYRSNPVRLLASRNDMQIVKSMSPATVQTSPTFIKLC